LTSFPSESRGEPGAKDSPTRTEERILRKRGGGYGSLFQCGGVWEHPHRRLGDIESLKKGGEEIDLSGTINAGVGLPTPVLRGN